MIPVANVEACADHRYGVRSAKAFDLVDNSRHRETRGARITKLDVVIDHIADMIHHEILCAVHVVHGFQNGQRPLPARTAASRCRDRPFLESRVRVRKLRVEIYKVPIGRI